MKKFLIVSALVALAACGGGGKLPESSANEIPIANAGGLQNIFAGTLVTLDGSASSDANSDALTYAWTIVSKPADSTTTLINFASPKPTFQADVAGTYVASLVVNDGKVSSQPSTVTVTATLANANAVPVANAGAAQNTITGKLVTLDGSASSDVNSDALTYAWTILSKPAGSAVILINSASPKPTFQVDVAGTYVASLVVNDGKVSSQPSTVTVTATFANANAAPVANAGTAQNTITGKLVTLDGSASSDANSDALTYAWTIMSKPAGSAAILISSDSPKPTFQADVAGTYVASLVVNDGKVSSTAASVSITATVINAAPVANAGIAQIVVAGSLVTLDGSVSSDANGDSLTYDWTLTTRPDGSMAQIWSISSGSSSAVTPWGDNSAPLNFGKSKSVTPTFYADVAGTYVAKLIVNDGKVDSSAATVAINVPVDANAPITPTGLTVTNKTSNSVTLTWNASAGGAGGVYSYQLYRNGYAIGGTGYSASTALSYTDVNLTPDIIHSYSVAAISLTGAKSLSSAAVEGTTLSLSLLKAKLLPFIIFETATGKIRGQAFASPGVMAAAASLSGFTVLNHSAIDATIFGIKPIGSGQYAIYRYSTGEVVEQPLMEMVLTGEINGNASYVTVDLNGGKIQSTGSGQTVTLLLNISGNANGGIGYLDKEIL